MFYGSIPCDDRISPHDERRVEMLKVLNLDSEETLDEKKINKTYRKLAMKHHPDRGGNEKDFIKIKTAHDFLTAKNEEERNKIFPPQSGNDGGGDIFETYFSDIVYRNLRENIREFFVFDWDDDSGDEEFLPQHGIFSSRQQGSFCIRHRKPNGRTNPSSRRRMQRKRSNRSKRFGKKEEKKGKVVDEEEERLQEAKAKVPRMPMKMKPPTVKKVFERSADLSWSEPQVVDDEDSEDTLEYFLELKIGEGYKFKPVYRGSELEYKITRLVPGNEYTVRIRCVNKYGTNEWSESSFKTEGKLNLDGGLDSHPEVWSDKKIQQEKRRVKNQRKKERKKQKAKLAREQALAERRKEEEKKRRNLEKQRENNRRHREEQLRKQELEKKKLQEQLWRRFTQTEETKKSSLEGDDNFNLESVDRKVQRRLWEQMSKSPPSDNTERKNKADSPPAEEVSKSSSRSDSDRPGDGSEEGDLKVAEAEVKSVAKPEAMSRHKEDAKKPKPVGSRPAVEHRSERSRVQDRIVDCPVCGDQISYLQNEEHIDLCLAKNANNCEPKERSIDCSEPLQRSQPLVQQVVSISPLDYVPESDVDAFDEPAPNCLSSRLPPAPPPPVVNDVNKVLYNEAVHGGPRQNQQQSHSSPLHQPWDSGPRVHSPLAYHAEPRSSPHSTESMSSRKQRQLHSPSKWSRDQYESSLHLQHPRQHPLAPESANQYSPPKLNESWRNEDQYRSSPQGLRLGKIEEAESRYLSRKNTELLPPPLLSGHTSTSLSSRYRPHEQAAAERRAPIERVVPAQSVFSNRDQPVQRSSQLYGLENRFETSNVTQHPRNPGDVFYDTGRRHAKQTRTHANHDYANTRYSEVDNYQPVRSLNGDPTNLIHSVRSQKSRESELTNLHHSIIRNANSSNHPQPVRSLNGDTPNLYQSVRGLHDDPLLDFQQSRESLHKNSRDPPNLHTVRSLKVNPTNLQHNGRSVNHENRQHLQHCGRNLEVDIRNLQPPVRSLNGDSPHLQHPVGSLNTDPPNLQRPGRRPSNDDPPNLYRDNSLQRSPTNLHQTVPPRRQYHMGHRHPVSRVQEPRLQQRYTYSQHQFRDESSSSQRHQIRPSPPETHHYQHNRPHRKEIRPLMRVSVESHLQGGGQLWDYKLPDPHDYVAAMR